jgi:hypothetical protein
MLNVNDRNSYDLQKIAIMVNQDLNTSRTIEKVAIM